MSEYLSNIIEETFVTCGVCEKQFKVNDMTTDDWNFAWDNITKKDCCNNCVEEAHDMNEAYGNSYKNPVYMEQLYDAADLLRKQSKGE